MQNKHDIRNQHAKSMFHHKIFLVKILPVGGYRTKYKHKNAGGEYGCNFDGKYFTMKYKVFSIFSHTQSEYRVYLT
jgi:hypothetical protein